MDKDLLFGNSKEEKKILQKFGDPPEDPVEEPVEDPPSDPFNKSETPIEPKVSRDVRIMIINVNLDV
jgi:hypothetical protein